MDIYHLHTSEIYVLRACHNDDATDLVAAGCERSVDVFQISQTDCKLLTSFHTGTRVTAVAWSSRTVSPSRGDEWLIELAAVTADFGLHILTKSHEEEESIFPFGGGLSGHHGRVNDITFCGGRGEDSTRYVATVSDDKTLMIWDLYPAHDVPPAFQTPTHSPTAAEPSISPLLETRAQPTAYVIAFSRPLLTVNAHISSSKEFLVSDSHGSVFITDWRSDPEDGRQSQEQELEGEDELGGPEETWYHPNLLELVEPNAYSENPTRHSVQWSGSAAWRQDTPDIIGATYGSKFSVWDVSNLHGGKPNATGTSFPEGGHRFRWCPTHPDIFGISTQSPHRGAAIHVHNALHVNAQPTAFKISSPPHFVHDFDFLAVRGIPRIATAIGRRLVVFSIGVDP